MLLILFIYLFLTGGRGQSNISMLLGIIHKGES